MRLIIMVVVLVELLVHRMLLIRVGHSMICMVNTNVAAIVQVVASLVVWNTW